MREKVPCLESKDDDHGRKKFVGGEQKESNDPTGLEEPPVIERIQLTVGNPILVLASA